MTTLKWLKMKKSGFYPLQPRSGASVVPVKKGGLFFGGVYDTEDTEEVCMCMCLYAFCLCLWKSAYALCAVRWLVCGRVVFRRRLWYRRHRGGMHVYVCVCFRVCLRKGAYAVCALCWWVGGNRILFMCACACMLMQLLYLLFLTQTPSFRVRRTSSAHSVTTCISSHPIRNVGLSLRCALQLQRRKSHARPNQLLLSTANWLHAREKVIHECQ